MSVRHSKFLSLVLRHDPGRIGISLDDAGWTDVAALLAACAAHGVVITRAQLDEIVATSDKQRFALSEDGTRVRANQGHTVEVDLQLAPARPPELLHHGTVERALAGVRELGLVRGARHHVHLSPDLETARTVGSRRGKPVILTIRAREMADAGHTFYRSANGVWLVDHVPTAFIDLPAPRGAGTGSRGAKVAIARATLAACDAGFYTNRRGERVELAEAIAAARDATRLYDPEVDTWTVDNRAASSTDEPRCPIEATAISVTGESTLAAIARLAPGGRHVACLNFASAKHPGGGFLGGAQAQEETLARSSGVYACQCAHPAFYDRNRANHSALYLDLVLFSPRVPFFRDDDGAWFDAPVLASVITCPAPNASALRQHGRFDAAEVEAALRRRAAIVLAVAARHRVDQLVLGAWGAGVFGNDPAMVARVFAELLRGPFASVFPEVVFAVLGDPATSVNHRAFVEEFGQRARV